MTTETTITPDSILTTDADSVPEERIDRPCDHCKKPFSALVCRDPFNPAKILIVQPHCGPCAERKAAEIAADKERRASEAAEREIEARWNRICPEIFRTTFEGGPTDLGRLQSEQPMLSEIMQHPLGEKGLVLKGGSGAGKTRCMFRLLRCYHVLPRRPKIVALTSGEFQRQAADAAGTYTTTEWFERLAKADAFFVDDLGKGKWSEATLAQFFELVDERTKNLRPIFITTNLNGDSLRKQWNVGEDYVQPMFRRIAENTRQLVLKSNWKLGQ